MNPRILVIDDDENLLKSIKKILTLKDYSVKTLPNCNRLDQTLENEVYDSVLLDVNMPGINGLEALDTVTQKKPAIPVIMISGQSDIQTAVECLKQGAYDFIEKPLDPERLFVTIKNAIHKHDLLEEKENIFRELQEKFQMVGESEAMAKVFRRIKFVADTQAKVLIQGESGTGKELVAWAIHHNSSRAGRPYIKLNCASVPAELLESQLFGHKRGSFTGAISDHKGKFLMADGGTLFLDEIGDMDTRLQAKLLRAIEESEIEVVGENIPRKVDVRIIAATNKNMEQLVREGNFREDLYHRLNVVRIAIPPLRERIADILPLAYHFLNHFNSIYNKQVLSISRQAEAMLINQPWPGNVRELRNIMEKLVVFADGKQISAADMQNALGMDHPPDASSLQYQEEEQIDTLAEARTRFEKDYLKAALRRHKWKLKDTAEALDIDRSNLFKKLKRYGIKK